MKAMMETGSGHVIKCKQTNLITLKCFLVIIKVEKNLWIAIFLNLSLPHYVNYISS